MQYGWGLRLVRQIYPWLLILGLTIICHHLTTFIIQHIDTLHKYGHKTFDVRRSTWHPTMTYIQRWKWKWQLPVISYLWENKMRELLHKNGKRKKKREKKKITDHLNGQKRGEICALCCSVSQQSWMKVDKACWKFQPLDALWTKEHSFRKFSVVIISGIRYRLDTFLEKFFVCVKRLRS